MGLSRFRSSREFYLIDPRLVQTFVFIPIYDSQELSSPISYYVLVPVSFLVAKLDQMPHWELSWDSEFLLMHTQIRLCFWSNCDHRLP